MSDIEKYGKTETESAAEEMFQARQIVSTILDFGVTQEQIVRIVKLLGLELVDRDSMLLIVNAAKQIEEGSNGKIIT